MNLSKEIFGTVAAMGMAVLSVGCAVAPRVPSTEAFSPVQSQPVNAKEIVIRRCDALGLEMPVVSGSQIIQGSVTDPMGFGVDGRQCRAGNTVALRLPVPAGASPETLMEALLRNQGMNYVPISRGTQVFAISGGNPGQEVGIMVFQDARHVFRVAAIPPVDMSVSAWRSYWNRVVKETRVSP